MSADHARSEADAAYAEAAKAAVARAEAFALAAGEAGHSDVRDKAHAAAEEQVEHGTQPEHRG